MKFLQLLALLVSSQVVNAISLDVDDNDSICAAAKTAAEGVMDYLDFSKGIGLLSDPYYWWHAGGVWGGMVDYWYLCDDDEYNDLIYESLLAQRGTDNNYIPSNQSTTEGNDDQGFWGLAVLEAAERNFTNPSSDIPGWLALAQAVFNTIWARWDTDHCGGGLRWQIFTWNSGYNYKNTISTACLYNIATRLGRYTSNDTYFDVADTAYEWLIDIGFVTISDGAASVYDGAEIDDNCTSITQIEWTYNFALLMGGSAYAYDATGDQKWLDRTNYFYQGGLVFFLNDIMYERACQDAGTCNNDQRMFKAFFSRFLGRTAQFIDSLYDEIMTLLSTSGSACAQTCVGGTDGVTCGLDWQTSGWDGYYGAGEQLSAMETFQNLVLKNSASNNTSGSGTSISVPLTNSTGGTSEGDASAGISSISSSTSLSSSNLNITGGDKAGAGVVTAIILAIVVGGSVWMVL